MLSVFYITKLNLSIPSALSLSHFAGYRNYHKVLTPWRSSISLHARIVVFCLARPHCHCRSAVGHRDRQRQIETETERGREREGCSKYIKSGPTQSKGNKGENNLPTRRAAPKKKVWTRDELQPTRAADTDTELQQIHWQLCDPTGRGWVEVRSHCRSVLMSPDFTSST